MSKAPSNDEQNPMVVLDAGGGSYTFYMRLADAVAAVQLLSRAQRIEYSWSDKCYKFTKTDPHNQGISVNVLSAAQTAQLHLEDEA